MKRERFYAIVDNLNKVLVSSQSAIGTRVEVYASKRAACARLERACSYFEPFDEVTKMEHYYSGFSYETWSTCRVAPVTIQEVLK